MIKLKVKNVGPIKNGFDSPDGFMEIKGVTVFIGNQGTGKSTIAKLYSILSWIEKALVRGDFTENEVMQDDRFIIKHLAYQNLVNYIDESSFIEYIGDAYNLKFENNIFIVTEIEHKNYSFPKIMYVPAERNFVSSIERPDLIKRLPRPLYTFMVEYENAKQQIGENFKLPIGNVSFEYKKDNKKSFIVGSDYNIEILEASSGFQSVTPLILVTQYLSNILKNKVDETRKEISKVEEEKIRKVVSKMFEGKTITEDVLKVVLEGVSAKFKYDGFINVVEEPEQNLYPESQKNILFELLKYQNENINNKLILTTHSPYILNFLNIAIQANYLKNRIIKEGNSEKKLLDKLFKIIPEQSLLSVDNVMAYQLDNSGNISRLTTSYGILSDKNLLNQFIRHGNDLFDSLLAIEEEI